MKQILVCIKCEAFVSNPVVMKNETLSTNDFAELEWENAAEPGEVLIIHNVYITYENGTKGDEVEELNYWLNTKDAAYDTNLDPKLSIGCCGPSGGVNTRCSCKSLIGSTYADCIGPHYFSPVTHNTKWIEYIEDEKLREQDRLSRLYQNSRVQKKSKRNHKKTK